MSDGNHLLGGFASSVCPHCDGELSFDATPGGNAACCGLCGAEWPWETGSPTVVYLSDEDVVEHSEGCGIGVGATCDCGRPFVVIP